MIWIFLLKENYLLVLDQKVYQNIKITNRKTVLFRMITTFASTFFLFIMSILLLLFLSNKTLAFSIVICLILDALIIWVCKHIIRRERPQILPLVYEKGYSFPSGHTFSATVFYGFWLFLLCLSSFSFLIKLIIGICLVFLIVLIGFSRIYLGVHYFSDVIGGILLGSSYLCLYVYIGHFILNII